MVTKGLRASVRSVERRRRAWREGGTEALRSAGPANAPTVTDAQFAVLEEELGKGPTAHGFEGERWTLARVQTVVRRRLRVSLSTATVWRLLKRHGWSWQAPARRALEQADCLFIREALFATTPSWLSHSPYERGPDVTAQINRSVKVTVGLTGVATLTIEGHEQGDPECPKVALGGPVLHGV
ncbi:winged helix-turn-helix domain-containing protein [Streptomyces sp. NPDC059881]|uniref:winged helix-turn-helix domain-containing protein n=1 Tax=Streptomyces sp. NPDC059881 TaxID=3346986 RepID=UPI00365BF5A5